jgi:endonuclease III
MVRSSYQYGFLAKIKCTTLTAEKLILQSMTLKDRYRLTFEYFEAAMPFADTELEYKNPFSLLVAVILSAQCTDKRVNLITPPLLEKYPDARTMSKAEISDIFKFIKSCSYPNNKARNLSGMSKMLVEEFGGKIPSDVKDLQRLPGVGRKTANVVASVFFKKPVIAVDTHVFRVANRIGLVRNATTPLSVEKQLSAHIPSDKMRNAHHWLLLHGRYICKARTPLCDQCGLKNFCQYYSSLQKSIRKRALIR